MSGIPAVCLMLGSALLLCAIGADAQEPGPQSQPPQPIPRTPPVESREDRSRNREFERFDAADRAIRAGALGRLAATGTLVPERIDNNGPDLEIVQRNGARDNLLELAGELQALYDLGGVSVTSVGMRNEIESRSAVAVDAARKLIDFLNRGTDPPPTDPVLIARASYDEHVLQLATLYLSIVESISELIDGDVLDIRKLEDVRRGLRTIDALVAALPESEFALVQPHQPFD